MAPVPPRRIGATIAGWALLSVLTAACVGDPQQGRWQRQAEEAATRALPADRQAAWLRITPAGLAALATTLLPPSQRSRRVPIEPSSQGDLHVCPGGGCQVALTISDLSLSPRDGALVISAVGRATTGPMPLRYAQRWPCAFTAEPACTVDIDTTRASPPDLRAEVPIALERRPNGAVAARIGALRVAAGLDAADVSIRGANQCGRFWCNVANVVGASRMLADRANRSLATVVGREVDRRACRACGAGCAGDQRCVEGICRAADGRCDPVPLGASYAFEGGEDGDVDDAGRPSLGPGRRKGMDLWLAVADATYADSQGLDLALRLSAVPRSRDRCVPERDAPWAVPLERSMLQRDLAAGADVRILIGAATLERGLWAAQQAGLLCATVNGAAISEGSASPWTPAALGALLPSAGRLSALGVLHPSVEVHPLLPPVLTEVAGGDLAVRAGRVRIELWAEVLGRRLRLAAAILELEVPLGFVASGRGLELSLDRRSLSLEITELWSAPLLGASESELRSAFATIGAVAREAMPARVTLLGEELLPPVPFRFVRAPRIVRGARSGGQPGPRAVALDLAFERPAAGSP